MPMWNPWVGCHKYSEGCRFCYIHKADMRKGIDTDNIRLSSSYNAPLKRNKKGEYQWKKGTVYLCFSSDFLIEEADEWRDECFAMIKERKELEFLFLTKRISRLKSLLPDDWDKGYENVTIGCTVENQETADRRLPIFCEVPIKHRNIICQPLLGPIDLSGYLDNVELVVVGGESDKDGREMDFSWVLNIRKQCIEAGVNFEFRQCSSNFIKNGKLYKLNRNELTAQARKANINYRVEV